jgi:hypothetical protein
LSLYDTIKPHLALSDKEIAELPGLLDTPRKVPLWQLQEVLLASGAWVILDEVAKTDTDGGRLAKIILGLFSGKLDSFDAVKYQALGYQALALMNATGVSAEAIAAVSDMIGLGKANPTVEEIAAARAEGEWNDARTAVEQAIDAKYAAHRVAYNAAKNALGKLVTGDKIPSLEELWA